MPFHRNSRRAASYIEAAREQGKFSEMLDIVFKRQDEWGDQHGCTSKTPPESFEVLFERHATEIGLSLVQVRAAVASNKYEVYLERDFTDGQSVGVTKTPTFFINGRELLQFGQLELRALIEDELKKN